MIIIMILVRFKLLYLIYHDKQHTDDFLDTCSKIITCVQVCGKTHSMNGMKEESKNGIVGKRRKMKGKREKRKENTLTSEE